MISPTRTRPSPRPTPGSITDPRRAGPWDRHPQPHVASPPPCQRSGPRVPRVSPLSPRALYASGRLILTCEVHISQRIKATCSPITCPVSGAAGLPAWPRPQDTPLTTVQVSEHAARAPCPCASPALAQAPHSAHTKPAAPSRRLATPAPPSSPGHRWMPQTFLWQVVHQLSTQHRLGPRWKGRV